MPSELDGVEWSVWDSLLSAPFVLHSTQLLGLYSYTAFEVSCAHPLELKEDEVHESLRSVREKDYNVCFMVPIDTVKAIRVSLLAPMRC